MRLFSKKKNKELHPYMVRLLKHVNEKLLHYAGYLQQKTNHYSKRKRLVFLFLLCFVLVTESTIIIISSLQKSDIVSITVAPIRFITPHPGNPVEPVFSELEYKRIERFRQHLDADKVFRDSLLALRPHLIDTLNILQKIYKKNEK